MDSFIRQITWAIVLLVGLCACTHDPAPFDNVPVIQMVDCLNVTDSSAVLSAKGINFPRNGECVFRYGPAMNLNEASSQECLTSITNDDLMNVEIYGLLPSTVYYVQATIRKGKMSISSDVQSFTTLEREEDVIEPENPEPPEGPEVPSEPENPEPPEGPDGPDGPDEPDEPGVPLEPVELESVDLGLSIKWANLNIGAQRPEYSGELFAWGEHSQKESYSWDNYVFKASDGSFTKYNVDTSHGNLDYRIFLDPSDDPAVYAINSRWRTPTYAEWEELRDGCDWVWTDDYSGTGVPGFIVSGRGAYSENSIFLPEVAGSDGVPVGHYWTSELFTSDSKQAYCFSFLYDCTAARTLGYPIRPVTGEPALVQATSIELDGSEAHSFIDLSVDDMSYGIAYAIEPKNARNKDVMWTSTNPDVVEVDSKGVVSYKGYGEAVIVATLLDGGMTRQYKIFVSLPQKDESEDKSGSKESYGFEYVDMGLSVKWAGFDLGASEYFHVGSLFAWADTKVCPVSSEGIWTDYKYYDAATDKLTKYNVNPSDGIVDNIIVLEPSDDAATAILGSDWHTPTREEWKELYVNCTWHLVTNLGIAGTKGYIVTSNIPGYEDRSIYLPLAPHWTASISPYFDSHYAFRFNLAPYDPIDHDPTGGGSWRCYPAYIRPVRK